MMKKIENSLILLLLLIVFVSLFYFNDSVKIAILDATKLWFYNLVPFMLSMNIITDLLLNYGLGDLLFKLFKQNYVFLIVVSMLLGTPSNAKYIKEFYMSKYIDKQTANWLLLFSYSPNPLFVIGMSPNLNYGFITLCYIYSTNLLIAVFSKKKFKMQDNNYHNIEKTNFSKCIENSIYKSFNILILVLGIIAIYAVVIVLIDIMFPNTGLLIKTVLEMTNALDIISNYTKNVLLWMCFACSFGGLSIHTQIKSILEDTFISYKYFFIGRLIASLPILIIIVFN